MSVRDGRSFTGLSIVAAVNAGIVEWVGLVAIALFAGACFAAMRSTFSTPVRTLAWGTLVICAVMLAAHQIPWINNVLVFDAVAVSHSAELYTLYWNYDKALAGVLLYVVRVQPQQRTGWSSVIITTTVLAVLTPALVVVPALVMGFVVWNPKLPSILVMWVPANLLVTCLAEETFFRGLLQRHLAKALRASVPSAGLVALLVRCGRFWYCTHRWRHCVCLPCNSCRYRIRRSLPDHAACRSKHPGAFHPEFGALDAVYLSLHRIRLNDGAMFDPTIKTEPDTASSLEAREVGGLGLYLIKSFAERVFYDFVVCIVKTAPPTKSKTYAPLEFRAEDGETPPLCSTLLSSSSHLASVPFGRCVGAAPTWCWRTSLCGSK